MLHDGVVLILPSVKLAFAEVAYRIVRATRGRSVEEASSRKLHSVSISVNRVS